MSADFELHKKLFLNYLRNEKSLSENTISSYTLDINKFFSYLENIKKISKLEKITDKSVSEFLGYLNKSGNKLEE
ncbi:MAG: site-specific integrase, partial [Ignavibacteria bacterium]|nr:site-specific integrase [Ignavibacteria bacterium]